MVDAGLDKLSALGYIVQLDDLAGGDPLKYEPLLQFPVGTIYLKFLKDRISSEVQKEYANIKKRKVK